MRSLATLILLSFTVFNTGCLSSSHRISNNELANLAQIAPEERGNKVRVVQALGNQNPPPAHDGVRSNTVVVVHSPIWIGGRPYRHNHREHQRNNNPPPTGKSGGISNQGSGSSVASNKKDSAKAWIALAAVGAIALAATEGARYDGWVNLHPMHPVHLYGPYGEYLALPLAHIDAATAAWADHGVVLDTEGPWQPLGRAPLYRKGFTYSLLLGSGQIPVEGLDADPGFTSHIQFGYFPTPQIGLQLDIAFAWTDDNRGDTIYVSRNSLELQAFLAKAGPLHGGGFAQLGISTRFDDGISTKNQSGLMGGGGLLQLDITTRLALTGRVGVIRSFGELSREITVGLSIY